MKRTLGFTLIELLVVIAIIMVLAAIILPVYGRAKGAGQKTECLSNIRQIGAATLMYVDEQGGIPIAGNGVYFTGWMSQIGLEDANSVKLRCPSYHPFSLGGADEYTKHDGGYAINFCMAPGFKGASQPRNPSKTVLVAEATQLFVPQAGLPYWEPFSDHSMPGPDCLYYTEEVIKSLKGRLADQYACRRHSGGSNYALLDGNARWLKPESIRYWSGTDDPPCLMNPPGKWIGPEDGFTFQILDQ